MHHEVWYFIGLWIAVLVIPLTMMHAHFYGLLLTMISIACFIIGVLKEFDILP